MASLTAAARSSNPDSFKKEHVLVSAHGSWDIAHLNASATAQTAAELIRPFSVSSANVVPIRTHHSTRMLVRCRYGAAGVVTTSPVVRLFSVYGTVNEGDTTLADDGTIRAVILARAQTIACVPATDVRDATYSYSDPLTLTLTDGIGSNAALVFIETAASITGVTPVIELMLLN